MFPKRKSRGKLLHIGHFLFLSNNRKCSPSRGLDYWLVRAVSSARSLFPSCPFFSRFPSPCTFWEPWLSVRVWERESPGTATPGGARLQLGEGSQCAGAPPLAAPNGRVRGGNEEGPPVRGLDSSSRGKCRCHLSAPPEPSGFCSVAPWRTHPCHSVALTVSATSLASRSCHATENCSTHLPARTVRRVTTSLGPTAVSSVGGVTVIPGAWSTTAGPMRLAGSLVLPVARISPIPWPSRAT